MNKRVLNKFIMGKLGPASKTIHFEENEFRKELAPPNASIERLEINGEKFVKMHYKL